VTASRARTLALAAIGAVAAAACGAKGRPMPPLRPIPVAVSDFSIERDGAASRLRILIPDTNRDGSTPPAVDRIEIYALTQAAEAAGPGTTELIVAEHLVGTVEVRPSTPPKEGAPPDKRPAAGDVTTFIDMTPPAAGSIRYFAAVASAGRRRSGTGTILPVPLGEPPSTPSNVKIDFTERRLTLTWDAASADARYIVEETDAQGASPKRVTVEPLQAAGYDEPVAFGKNRCLTVRAAQAKGAVLIVGAPSAPVCTTPQDKFPPPVPGDLQALAGDTGIELAWTSVQAADLAGYIILRADGPNGTLRELTSTPVASSAYSDTTVRSGSSYVYAVVSVDKAGNKSEMSNKAPATARIPFARERRER